MHENWVPWLEQPSIQQARVADKCFIVTKVPGKRTQRNLGREQKNKKCEKKISVMLELKIEQPLFCLSVYRIVFNFV